MRKKLQRHIDLLIERYPALKVCNKSIKKTFEILEKCFADGNKLLIVGNGGSYADAEHIVGELMKGFKLKRTVSKQFANKLKLIDLNRGEKLAEKLQRGLPAVALGGHQSLNTAFVNDVENSGLLTFAQQVFGYGKKEDVLLGISTSGNSESVINAAVVAKALDMKIISLTGKNGGKLKKISDVSIVVPSNETYMIQELHLPVYHCLCLMLEERFFDE